MQLQKDSRQNILRILETEWQEVYEHDFATGAFVTGFSNTLNCCVSLNIFLKTIRDTSILSMFQEWGTACPPFDSAWKLEADMTWTPEHNIVAREDENMMIDKILKAGSQLQLKFSQ